YHVVAGTGADATATLDGFTITAGRADAPRSGGGFVTLAGGPTLRNCTITGNAGGCGGDLHAAGGVLAVGDSQHPAAGLTLVTTSSGADFTQTILDVQGPLYLQSAAASTGTLDVFGCTLTGPGKLELGAGTLLKVRAAPPCNTEIASQAAGTLGA